MASEGSSSVLRAARRHRGQVSADGINGIKEGIDRGLARVMWHRPRGGDDEIGIACSRGTALNPAYVVIDGMQGFERAADLPERLSDVYSAIAQELERRRVTTLYTTETRGLFESDINVPINGLSAATQNIILSATSSTGRRF